MRYILKIELFNEVIQKQAEQVTIELKELFLELKNKNVCDVYGFFINKTKNHSTLFVDVECVDIDKVFNEITQKIYKSRFVFGWNIQAFLDIENRKD